MQAIGHFVAMAFEEYPEFTAAAFYGGIVVTFRYADNRFHLFLIVAFGDVVYQLFDDIQAFHDFIHADEIACPGITFGADNFFKVHLAIHAVRHTLTHIASPTAGTTCASGGAEGYGIFTRQYPYAFQTLLRNDVSRKHIVVFMQDAAQVRNEFFYLFLEVGSNVGLYAANCVIVHDEASAAGSFKDVQNLLAIAKTVEESGQCAEVHCQAGVEKQV